MIARRWRTPASICIWRFFHCYCVTPWLWLRRWCYRPLTCTECNSCWCCCSSFILCSTLWFVKLTPPWHYFLGLKRTIEYSRIFEDRWTERIFSLVRIVGASACFIFQRFVPKRTLPSRTLHRFRCWSAAQDGRKSLTLHCFSSQDAFIMIRCGFILCQCYSVVELSTAPSSRKPPWEGNLLFSQGMLYFTSCPIGILNIVLATTSCLVFESIRIFVRLNLNYSIWPMNNSFQPVLFTICLCFLGLSLFFSALFVHDRFRSGFSDLGLIWRGKALSDQLCQFLTRNKSLSNENDSSMISECVRIYSVLPPGAGVPAKMSTRENVHLTILRQCILIRRQNSPVKRSRENVHQPRIWTSNSLHFAHAVHLAHGRQNVLLSFDCRSDWFWQGFCTLPDQNLPRHTKAVSCSLVFFILFFRQLFVFPKKCTRFRRHNIAAHRWRWCNL